MGLIQKYEASVRLDSFVNLQMHLTFQPGRLLKQCLRHHDDCRFVGLNNSVSPDINIVLSVISQSSNPTLATWPASAMQAAMDKKDPPPVVRPGANAPYHPTSDPATYRDLLLFEERFKRNAEMLTKRSRRYSSELSTCLFVA